MSLFTTLSVALSANASQSDSVSRYSRAIVVAEVLVMVSESNTHAALS